MYRTLFIVAAMLLLASGPAQAGSYYVSKSGSNGGGTSWTSAWNEFSQVNWKTVGPGSTLYVAAGTYTTCFPTITISGITIKRATVSDHGTSEGWNESLDGIVLVDHAPNCFLDVKGVNGFTFDGTSHSPWKFREEGITGRSGQLLVRNSKNVTIRNVELDGNSEKTLDGGPEDGLRVGYSDNLVVEHCYIHDYRQYPGKESAHEDAVQMPSGNHVTFRYNIFANCGMLLYLGDIGWDNQWVNGITIEHNLFYCESGIGGGTYNAVVLGGTNKQGTDTTRIENNTFAIRSDERSRRVLYYSGGGMNNKTNNYFRNNIIYNSSVGDVGQVPDHSYNCYFNPFKPGDKLTETGGIYADPLFVNYAGNDFHLQNTSPCIKKGTKLGWRYDMDGNKIRKKPNMGCF
jgi:pectate lyase